jgi:hypothetical protein
LSSPLPLPSPALTFSPPVSVTTPLPPPKVFPRRAHF